MSCVLLSVVGFLVGGFTGIVIMALFISGKRDCQEEIENDRG